MTSAPRRIRSRRVKRRKLVDLIRRREEGVDDPHRAIVAAVLEVLGEDFAKPMDLGMRPQMRVEPGKLVSRYPAQPSAQHFRRWVDNRIFRHKQFRFDGRSLERYERTIV